MEGRSDVQLIERLLVRDESALREVIEQYGGVVHGMARRVLAEPALAEEVAQDAFLALWRRPGAFDPSRGSLQSFLLGIVRNKAIDLVRKEESLRRTRDALAKEFPVTDEGYDPGAEVDERHRVMKALGTLSDVQREAVVLAYFGGRTYREVAVELEIPEGTAKTRLRDALIRLRQVLSPSESEGLS